MRIDEPNDVTYKAMRNAETGEDVYGPYESVSAMMEALDA